MSITSISATQGGYAAAATSGASPAKDFAALSQALQQGDLTGAQQAFATLQQDSPWVGRLASGSAAPGGGAPVASALQALGNALHSGDLTGAQQALANLQQAHGGHHGHHHHSEASQPAADASTAATPAAGSVDALA